MTIISSNSLLWTIDENGGSMAKERLVVIGGNAAGMSAASQARRRDQNLEIIAFENGPVFSYAA